MYDTSFECKYPDTNSDEDYRGELLRAFKLNEPAFDSIIEVLEELAPVLSTVLSPVYQKMRDEQTVLSHLLLSISNRQNTDVDLLIALCAVDTFACLHAVICDVLDSQESSASVSNLLDKLHVAVE